MQAFGPYLNKTTIDFTSLYDHGLFLITGSTGCGKTTILDAMSYALYGRASGTLRDVRDMRSIAAPDSLETSVVFEMDLGGTLYKFERAMKIRVVKKRSGASERVTDYVESCYSHDGTRWSLICTGTNVKDKAVELLGFSHEQFSQVVVLPQGEFRKLLTASSSEKQKILENLFGTARWQTFTKSLAQQSKSLETRLAQCAERTATLCKSVECENLEALDNLLNKTRQDFSGVEKCMKQLVANFNAATSALNDASALEEKFAQLDSAHEKIKQLENQTQDIDNKRQRLDEAGKASMAAPYLDALEQAQKTLETAQKDFEAAKISLAASQKEKQAEQKALDASVDDEERLKKLDEKRTQLKSMLEPARQLCSEVKMLENKRKDQAAGKAEIQRLAEKTEQLQNTSEDLKARIKQNYEKFVSRLPELVAQKAKLTEQISNFDDLETKKKNASKLEKKLEEKRAEYKRISQLLKNEKAALEDMQKALDADAAFRLSHQLHDGEKCPVCGSTTHPSPAFAVNGAPSKEEIDTQKSIVDKLEEEKKQSLEDGSRIRGDYDAAAKQLSDITSECEKYNCAPEKARAQLSAVTKELEEAQTAEKRQHSMEEDQKANDSSLAKTKEEYDSLKAQADKTDLEISALEGRIEQLGSAVPEDLRDADAILSQINKLKKDYDDTDRRIKETRSRFESACSALAAVTERLRFASNKKSSDEEKYKSAKTEFERRFTASGLADSADIRALILTDEESESLKDAIEKFEREMLVQKDRAAALEKQLADAKRPDIKSLQQTQAKAREKMEQSLSQKGALEVKIKNLDTVRKQLVETAEREEKLRADFALYDHIYRLSNGDNPLKTPIHQFVLGIMLDDIVSSANIHLSKLSRGRYTLVRSTQMSRGGGTKGLELAVGDAWSGGERSVNTLSGGEMFLASLSLAFGLSDVVQSYAGGIRLDSLFIDEGFGSLDNETLDTAMSALESLRLSGRLIGVISHVGELSERIPAHIKVKRLADGSSAATVETP